VTLQRSPSFSAWRTNSAAAFVACSIEYIMLAEESMSRAMEIG
jgi:hypothetical protein